MPNESSDEQLCALQRDAKALVNPRETEAKRLLLAQTTDQMVSESKIAAAEEKSRLLFAMLQQQREIWSLKGQHDGDDHDGDADDAGVAEYYNNTRVRLEALGALEEGRQLLVAM